MQRCPVPFLAIALCTALLALGSAPARAGVFHLHPTGVELQPGRLTSTVTLTNPGPQPLLIEAAAYDWRRSEGKDELTASEDLIVVPPVLQLQPGAEQTVRVGLRRPPAGEAETPWRVKFSEVPSESSARFGVSIALEISIPVFFTPTEARPELTWELETASSEEVAVRLVNQGLTHLKVFEVSLLDEAGEAPFATSKKGAYVLPGGRERFGLEIRRPVGSGVYLLRAQTQAGPVETRVDVTNGVPRAAVSP